MATLLAVALVGLATVVGWGGSVTLVSIDDFMDTPASSRLGLLQLRRFSRTRQANHAACILPELVGHHVPQCFEDVVGGTLSDRLLVTYDANSSIVDVQFASDPATIALPLGASNFANFVENGSFQPVGFFQA